MYTGEYDDEFAQELQAHNLNQKEMTHILIPIKDLEEKLRQLEIDDTRTSIIESISIKTKIRLLESFILEAKQISLDENDFKNVPAFIQFIKERKFHLYKDGKWYSNYKRNYQYPQVYYTDEQLFEYFKQEQDGKESREERLHGDSSHV